MQQLTHPAVGPSATLTPFSSRLTLTCKRQCSETSSGVGNDEDLLKLGFGEFTQLLHEQTSPVDALAAEDLVEDHKTVLGAAPVGGTSDEPVADGGEVWRSILRPSSKQVTGGAYPIIRALDLRFRRAEVIFAS